MTDTCTGLMWQKATAPDPDTWWVAIDYCESLNLGGHDDWRLPNVRELQSIVDYGRKDPSIDPGFEAVSYGYWSYTTYARNPDYAWVVYFHVGNVIGNSDIKGSQSYVRAVRLGQ